MTLLSRGSVPARDEQDNIGPCLSSLLLAAAGFGLRDRRRRRQVDRPHRRDRSFDAWRQVGRPSPLAAGWCGKTHALAFAAPTTSGSWILFTDADTRHSPGSLQGVLERAGEYDLYSLSPEQETVTWSESAVIPRVFAELERLFSYDDINRPDSEVAAANGQFLLIRRSAYDALGGHGTGSHAVSRRSSLGSVGKAFGIPNSPRPRQWRGQNAHVQPVSGNVARLDEEPVSALRAGFSEHASCGRTTAVDLPGGPLLSVLLVNSLHIRHRCHLALTWKGREYPALSPVTDRPTAEGGGTCPTGLQ